MRTILIVSLLAALVAAPLQAFNIPGLSNSNKETSTETTAKSAEEIQKELNTSLDKAKDSFSDNPELVARLNNIQTEANNGEDQSMIEDLKGLANIPGFDAASLTDGQKGILKEVQGHATALALTRNFSHDPSMAGPVTHAVNAVQSGDTTAAVSSLKEVASQGNLTNSQKTLVKSMLGSYSGYLDKASKASDAVGSIRSMF